MRNTTIWQDFKSYVLYSGNVLNQLVAVNVIAFLAFGIFWLILKLLSLDDSIYIWLNNLLSLPSSPLRFIYKPWSIITYQFMHAGIGHIFFNMLILLFAGRIMREYLGDRKLLSTYLIGGMAGGVLYILSYNLFPFFSGMQANLVGASASIMAILAAIGTLLPRYTVFIIIIGPVQLVYIVFFLFAIDLLSIIGDNSGGHISHIGGMIWGYTYVKFLQNGTDMGEWLNVLLDKIAGIFKKKSHLRTSYVNQTASLSNKKSSKKDDVSQETIDAILDKIAASGYDSLSTQEKNILMQASKDNKS